MLDLPKLESPECWKYNSHAIVCVRQICGRNRLVARCSQNSSRGRLNQLLGLSRQTPSATAGAPDEDFRPWSGHLSHRFLQRLTVTVSTNSGTNARAMYGLWSALETLLTLLGRVVPHYLY